MAWLDLACSFTSIGVEPVLCKKPSVKCVYFFSQFFFLAKVQKINASTSTYFDHPIPTELNIYRWQVSVLNLEFLDVCLVVEESSGSCDPLTSRERA